MKNWAHALVPCLALLGCGKPVGLDTQATPLVHIHILVTGDIPVASDDGGVPFSSDDGGSPLDAGLGPAPLHAALVWGRQWLPEPFCFLPAESPQAAKVIEAGCRDSFGFVPRRVAADTLITPGVPATIELDTLPAADVMVGDLGARIAYASVVVYGDRNGNGILDLRRPARQRRQPDFTPTPPGNADTVYGASFISMTLPDRRIAFREGDFDSNAAFYPRVGCPEPPRGFSILSAGGFSFAAAVASGISGVLPAQDPSTCGTASLDDTIVIPLRAPSRVLSQLACSVNDVGGVTYYREAPAPSQKPDLSKMVWACTSFPRLGSEDGGTSAGQQLVIASPPTEPCLSTLHYSLRGCDNDSFCASPAWDIADNPPDWWPCPKSP